MDRQEQKERLKGIFDNLIDSMELVKKSDEELESVYQNIANLEDSMYQVSIDFSDYFDADELKNHIFASYIEEQANISDIYNDLQDFKSELDDYMSELSDSRRERLEDKYLQLDEVIDSLDIDIECNGFSTQDVTDILLDCLDKLKDIIIRLR